MATIVNPIFVITQVGLNAVEVPPISGPWINIATFQLGSGYGYTPGLSDTALHGTSLYTGTPYSYSIDSSNALSIQLIVDESIGSFQFGEIGLYLSNGTLFALTAFDSLQEKLKGIGNQVGSKLVINALLKLAQAPLYLYPTTGNTLQLLTVDKWADLLPPTSQLTLANAAIIQEPDPQGQFPIVMEKGSLDWTIYKYYLRVTDTISSSTTTTVTSPYLSSMYFDGSTNRRYLIKVLNTGLIRSVFSITAGVATINDSFSSPPTGNIEIWEADYYRGKDTSSIQVPLTGFSITILTGTKDLVLNPAGTLALGTVTLPALPNDGDVVNVSSTQTITGLTVSPSAGQTVLNAPTTLSAGTGFGYIYSASSTTWYRRY